MQEMESLEAGGDEGKQYQTRLSLPWQCRGSAQKFMATNAKADTIYIWKSIIELW